MITIFRFNLKKHVLAHRDKHRREMTKIIQRIDQGRKNRCKRRQGVAETYNKKREEKKKRVVCSRKRETQDESIKTKA